MFRATRRVHFALTILGCFGGGSLYGWSGYLPAVRAAFGTSNAAASMVFSLALVSFTLGVLLGPVLCARIPPHLRLPLLAGMAALSLALAGANFGFTGFALAYGLCFGFASGALYNHTVDLAAGSPAPNLLVPVSVAAFGLGGAVFGPLQLWLSAAGWGLWSTALALACLTAVTTAALLIRPPTAQTSDQAPTSHPIVKPDKQIAVLWIIFAAGSAPGLIVLGFAAQILPRGAEGLALASLAVFTAALGNTLGRLSCALTVGFFGPAKGVAAALTLSMVTLFCLIFLTAPAILVALLFVAAFAYGQLAATIPLLVKSLVGPQAFSSAFGWVFTGWGLAGLIGPWTAGWLLDLTGTLQASLIACIALCAVSLGLVLRLPNRTYPQETR